MEVIRSIPPGGEIFVSYGDEYWKDAHSTTHCTLDIPDWEWDMSDPFAPTSDATAPVPSPVLAPIPVSTPVRCESSDQFPNIRPLFRAPQLNVSQIWTFLRLLPIAKFMSAAGYTVPGVCAWLARLLFPLGGVRRRRFNRLLFLSSCVLCRPPLLPV